MITHGEVSGNQVNTVVKTESNQSGTTLSIPSVITAPGVYILTTDYTGIGGSDAITIQSDDVLLLGRDHLLQGNTSGSYQNAGIRISGGGTSHKNITISSVEISGFNSGVLMEDIKDAQIQDCSVHNNRHAGISVTNGTDLNLTSSVISSTHPVAGGTGGNGLIISNSDNITIHSVQVIGTGTGGAGSGIQISHSSGIRINESASVINAGSGISIDGNNSELVISNANISANGENGIAIGAGCSGLEISESRISKNTLTGIEVISGTRGLIYANVIDNNQVGLSLSESEHFQLKKNHLRNNKINLDVTGSSPDQYQHQIDTSNLADNRPIWYLTNSSGVQIGSHENPSCIYAVHCTGLSITDQIVTNNGAGIFLIDTDSATIQRVSSLDNTFGIRIGYGSRNISIINSSTETNLIAGYTVSGSDNITFKSCAAQNNLIGYFLTSTSTVLVESCNAYKQQGLRRRGPSGFLISDCTNVSIINSSARENQFDGIYLKNSPDTRIINSIVSANDIAGVAVLSERFTMVNSTVSSNGVGGILIYGNSSILQGNQIIKNNGRGLLIDSVIASRIWNNIFNNSRNVETSGDNQMTQWNITLQSGTGITNRVWVGGNYWGAPNKSGYSDTCNPDTKGFCNSPYQPESNGTDFYPISRILIVNNSSSMSQTSSHMSNNDLDQNGRVNLQDVIILMNLIGSGNTNISSYDFNHDSRVNLEDVIVFFHQIS
ncbi:MAG: right-handed parallel beta-helix repeat-containing protein [Methanospirillum sp.]|uniref:NosD domain-containing protein n=1 Tax=Methanospirillum sp. TaxID=45200 RepID=UPI0023698F4D|nr:right-handed parallel beta-helix repeat-containing protein [Methanospirillum sp.]MDD1729626.1 right-handed parallel beta-helix repeat-containing protein [Methanospirillum sp.]